MTKTAQPWPQDYCACIVELDTSPLNESRLLHGPWLSCGLMFDVEGLPLWHRHERDGEWETVGVGT